MIQADDMSLLALENYGVIDNIVATKINITSSDAGIQYAYDFTATGFVLYNYGKISNVKLEIGNITVSAKEGNPVYGFAVLGGDVDNIDLIFNNSTIRSAGSKNYASTNMYGFAATISSGENITISGTGTIESAAPGGANISAIASNVANVNNSNFDFSNITITGKNEMRVYGLGSAENFTNNKITYGNINGLIITFNGLGSLIKGEIRRNVIIAKKPINLTPSAYFFGFAKTANAKSINNNSLIMESISILKETGYGERYWFIKDGNTEIHNNYVYAGGNETGVFIGSTIKSYFSAELTINNKSDATIKKVYGISSPDNKDIPVKVGDNLLKSLEKWVKKNGTFDNQYARWGVKDGSFPYLTYENPITELLYNGEIDARVDDNQVVYTSVIKSGKRQFGGFVVSKMMPIESVIINELSIYNNDFSKIATEITRKEPELIAKTQAHLHRLENNEKVRQSTNVDKQLQFLRAYMKLRSVGVSEREIYSRSFNDNLNIAIRL